MTLQGYLAHKKTHSSEVLLQDRDQSTMPDDEEAVRAASGLTQEKLHQDYRGTSFIRKRLPLGPYSKTMPRALWGS